MSIFSDINKVQIMGNVTQDPEVKYTQGGTAVCTLSIATNRSYKKDDDWKEEVEFHSVVLWGKLAEHVEKRVRKGTRILIDGRLQTRSWEDKEGNKKYKTEIVASSMNLIARYEESNKDQVEEVFEDMEAPQDKEDDSIHEDDLPF